MPMPRLEDPFFSVSLWRPHSLGRSPEYTSSNAVLRRPRPLTESATRSDLGKIHTAHSEAISCQPHGSVTPLHLSPTRPEKRRSQSSHMKRTLQRQVTAAKEPRGDRNPATGAIVNEYTHATSRRNIPHRHPASSLDPSARLLQRLHETLSIAWQASRLPLVAGSCILKLWIAVVRLAVAIFAVGLAMAVALVTSILDHPAFDRVDARYMGDYEQDRQDPFAMLPDTLKCTRRLSFQAHPRIHKSYQSMPERQAPRETVEADARYPDATRLDATHLDVTAPCRSPVSACTSHPRASPIRSTLSATRPRFPLKVTTSRGVSMSPKRTAPMHTDRRFGHRQMSPEGKYRPKLEPDSAKSMQKMSLQLQELIKLGQEALSSTVDVAGEATSDERNPTSPSTEDESVQDSEMNGLLSEVPTRQLMLLFDESDKARCDDQKWDGDMVGEMEGSVWADDCHDTCMILRRP